MTLDEVISYNHLFADMETKSGDLEVAEYYRDTAKCLEELKELREKYREVVMEGEILNADYTEQVALNEQYKNHEEQYKRLLKVAVDDIARTESCFLCKYYDTPAKSCQTTDDCFVWRYADEACVLIGEDGNTNG